jgi:hypothetical protein
LFDQNEFDEFFDGEVISMDAFVNDFNLMVFRNAKPSDVEDKLVEFDTLIRESGGFINTVSQNLRDSDNGVSGTVLFSFEMPAPEEPPAEE